MLGIGIQEYLVSGIWIKELGYKIQESGLRLMIF